MARIPAQAPRARIPARAPRPRIMAFLHSQAELDSIKALLGKGLSLSQIGTQLGLTRSTVSGVAYRMKNGGGMAKPRRPWQRAKPKPKPVIVRPPQPQRSTGMCDLPIEPVPATAVPLIELGDNGCHWPVGPGTGTSTLFCNAERSGHVSYCRHHAARSVRVDKPRLFVAKCPRQLCSA